MGHMIRVAITIGTVYWIAMVLWWLLVASDMPPESPLVEPWAAEQEDRMAYCGLVARVGWDIHHEQVRLLIDRSRHPEKVKWETFDRMDKEVRKCQRSPR